MRIRPAGRWLILAAVLLLGDAPAIFAQGGNAAGDSRYASPAYETQARAAATLVRAYLEQSRVPGMAVAVFADGALVWSEGFGLADIEQQVPVTRHTRFRLASVSKLFAVAAAARLADAGALDLDAPVQQYVSDFPTHLGPPVTARLLAGQLGGVRHYRGSDFAGTRNIDRTVFRNTGAALAIFRDDSLVSPPGSRYHYSTFGYTLLGAAIEGAAGEEYPVALARLVLAPLGLTSTLPDRWDAIVPNRTRFYAAAGPEGVPVNAEAVLATYKWAGGGMLSTAEEVARFGAAHLRPGFLSEGALQQLFTSQRTTGGDTTAVGLGWRIGRDLEGRLVHHHAGSMEGARSVLLLYPSAGVVVAMLANRGTAPESPELMAQLLAAPFVLAPSAGSRTAPLVGTFDVRYTEIGGVGPVAVMRLDANGTGMIATPAALRDRSRGQGIPMTDSLPVVASMRTSDGSEVRVVASSLGLHALRLTSDGTRLSGEFIMALSGAHLRPASIPIGGSRRGSP